MMSSIWWFGKSCPFSLYFLLDLCKLALSCGKTLQRDTTSIVFSLYIDDSEAGYDTRNQYDLMTKM